MMMMIMMMMMMMTRMISEPDCIQNRVITGYVIKRRLFITILNF